MASTLWGIKLALSTTILTLAQPGSANECSALSEQLSTPNRISDYLTQETKQDVICAIALMPNGQESSYCYAIFGYRSEKARATLDELKTRLSSCFEPLAIKGAGAGENVNHPDSFDHYQFCNNTNTLSLSLKDKSALAQTLVFLRLDPHAPDKPLCK